jgi:histone H4
MGRTRALAPGSVFSPAATPGSGSSAASGAAAQRKTVPTAAGSSAVGRGRGGVRLRVPPPSRVGTPALRRLARRGGVKRISLACYDSVRDALRDFLDVIVRDIAVLVEHRRRMTVCMPDVLLALKRNGRTLYGWSTGGASARTQSPFFLTIRQAVLCPFRRAG